MQLSNFLFVQNLLFSNFQIGNIVIAVVDLSQVYEAWIS